MLRLVLSGLLLLIGAAAHAQEHVAVSYSSVEAPNANWYIAQDRKLYLKYGVDAESIFIPSSSTVINAIIGGSVKVGNGTGGAIASAAVAGANLVAVASFINTLPYELVVQETIKSAADLKGKSIGIARLGSASDVAARVLLRALGLEPDKDVAIIQGGSGAERVAAFRGGRIAGFPSPPGVIHLAKGIPHRVIITTNDLTKRLPFPYVCVTTTRSYLASNRETVKRIVMALIEGTHFFKTRKEESKRLLAKYSKQNNEAFLEASYVGNEPIFERLPLVTRDGMDIQLKEAIGRRANVNLKLDDIIDDSVVLQIEKEGFIERLYKQ
jgi:ABC-type nitrate/sulfonate/bicarbonate transport system substrate-binding protein